MTMLGWVLIFIELDVDQALARTLFVKLGQQVGASFLFFDCLEDLCCYIKELFKLEQPPIAMQTMEEQQQYAMMSVGQVRQKNNVDNEAPASHDLFKNSI